MHELDSLLAAEATARTFPLRRPLQVRRAARAGGALLLPLRAARGDLACGRHVRPLRPAPACGRQLLPVLRQPGRSGGVRSRARPARRDHGPARTRTTPRGACDDAAARAAARRGPAARRARRGAPLPALHRAVRAAPGVLPRVRPAAGAASERGLRADDRLVARVARSGSGSRSWPSSSSLSRRARSSRSRPPTTTRRAGPVWSSTESTVPVLPPTARDHGRAAHDAVHDHDPDLPDDVDRLPDDDADVLDDVHDPADDDDRRHDPVLAAWHRRVHGRPQVDAGQRGARPGRVVRAAGPERRPARGRHPRLVELHDAESRLLRDLHGRVRLPERGRERTPARALVGVSDGLRAGSRRLRRL